MRYKQLLEKRKNPELNPRTDINQELLRLNQNNNGDMYVSFTEIPKLGINPVNKYFTPTGIYCYQLDYVSNIIKNTNNLRNLPFAGDRKNVWVFNLVGNGISTSNYTNINTDFPKLEQIGISHNIDYSATDNFGGFDKLLCMINILSRELSGPNKKRHREYMTYFFYNILGYDYLSDTNGYFGAQEPSQCVIFNFNSIKNKLLLQNKTLPKRQNEKELKRTPYNIISLNDKQIRIPDDYSFKEVKYKNYRVIIYNKSNSNCPNEIKDRLGQYTAEIISKDEYGRFDYRWRDILIIFDFDISPEFSLKAMDISIKGEELHFNENAISECPTLEGAIWLGRNIVNNEAAREYWKERSSK